MSTSDASATAPWSSRLRALRDEENRLAEEKRAAIAEARAQGHSWAEIGQALGMSKQAAWELYHADVRAILERASNASGLDEDEAMALAVREVSEARAQRRRRATG